MARPKNSPEKIESMRNKMMDAVIELLDDVKPEKVSIRMIAEKIHVSHMVFYTYFENRDELMNALIDRQQKRIGKHFEGLLEKAASVPVIEVLKVVLRGYAETSHEHPKIYSLFWMTPKEERKGKQKIHSFRHLEPSLHNIAQLLELGMEKGEFIQRDSKLAALTVMAIMNAPLMLHRCGKKPAEYTCEQVLSETLTAVFAYLTTDNI
ncbi:MAG: TetR/AcrR family transcriptional regulator [Anaerolineaceae bacterium]|nr:TetR/AcrR family transcriptional regulator [Anaerolineaceae bacterium]